MPSPPPSRLREAVRGAVDRGLGFLEASIRPDGAWPSRMYWNLELTGSAEEELAPFVAALGALTLAASGDPRARSLQNRSGEFIVRSMRHPGVWALLAESPERSRQPQPLLPGGAVAPLGAVRHEPRMSAHGAGRPGKVQDLAGPAQRSRQRGRGQRGERQRRRLPRLPGPERAGRAGGGVAGRSGQGRECGGELPLLPRPPGSVRRPGPRPRAGRARVPGPRSGARGPDPGSSRPGRRVRRHAAHCARPSPPCTSWEPRRRAKRWGPRSSGSCAGNARTEAGRNTSSGRGPCRRIPPSVGFASAMLDTASCVEALVRSIPFPADPEPGVRRERPEAGHAQASREPARRSSSGTGVDRMKEREIVRGGTPIVCLAPRVAFQQEADSQLALSADHSGGPVPRISIEIVPDPAAEEPRPAEPAGEQGKKHD